MTAAAPPWRLLSTDVADLFGEPDPLLHPPPHRYRWHCTRCGRFVPFTGVRRLAPIPGEADDRDHQGDCTTCGRVDVVWGQT